MDRHSMIITYHQRNFGKKPAMYIMKQSKGVKKIPHPKEAAVFLCLECRDRIREGEDVFYKNSRQEY